VSENNLELEILRKVGLDKKKTIVIRGDQNVPYKSVMKVIDLANKNKLKMILAVKGK
jgi:biopolymer transport protein ExbD